MNNGRVMGTPHYTAPELFDGYVDERSEVYAVGILLYQALTGTLPFDDPSDLKICLHHRETRPLAPSFINPSITRGVERVILRALEKDPRYRYQSVEALLHAFQRALEAPDFFGYLSTHWHITREKLRSRRTPETPPCQPAAVHAVLDRDTGEYVQRRCKCRTTSVLSGAPVSATLRTPRHRHTLSRSERYAARERPRLPLFQGK
jgi:serine/threonine protein kinase